MTVKEKVVAVAAEAISSVKEGINKMISEEKNEGGKDKAAKKKPVVNVSLPHVEEAKCKETARKQRWAGLEDAKSKLNLKQSKGKAQAEKGKKEPVKVPEKPKKKLIQVTRTLKDENVKLVKKEPTKKK